MGFRHVSITIRSMKKFAILSVLMLLLTACGNFEERQQRASRFTQSLADTATGIYAATVGAAIAVFRLGGETVTGTVQYYEDVRSQLQSAHTQTQEWKEKVEDAQEQYAAAKNVQEVITEAINDPSLITEEFIEDIPLDPLLPDLSDIPIVSDIVPTVLSPQTESGYLETLMGGMEFELDLQFLEGGL